jgi:AmiR/NasT family two-component response regulator
MPWPASCLKASLKTHGISDLRIAVVDKNPLRAAIKALVMRAKAIPEEQAYALMRHVATNENKKIAEVARSIITAAELLR